MTHKYVENIKFIETVKVLTNVNVSLTSKHYPIKWPYNLFVKYKGAHLHYKYKFDIHVDKTASLTYRHLEFLMRYTKYFTQPGRRIGLHKLLICRKLKYANII